MLLRATMLSAALVAVLPVGASAQPTFSGSEVRITSDLGDQYDPAISGDLIVYTDFRGSDTDIWYYDLAAEQHVQVTQGAGDQELEDVSAGLIAYTDYDTADVIVYSTIDGSQVNLTASAGAISINPAISGSIVAWEDRRDGNPEIYARDLATGEERRITVSSGEVDIKPAVGGGVIAWQACVGSSCDVRTYDWRTGQVRALTATATGDERRPDVEAGGGAVVYDGLRDGEQDLYYFDLASGVEKRLALAGEQINANVSGDFVAFEELIDAGYHIRLWHVPSGSVFDVTTATAGYQYLNDIDGNRIVYTDDRNSHLDIYMFEFSVVFPPPAVVDCASALASGAAPLFDSTFRRSVGRPNFYAAAFSAPQGPGLLCIENGPDGAAMASAVTFSLNAQILLRAGDFADADGLPLPSIEREALLLPANFLAVRMAGEPGSAIRVRLYALDSGAAAVPASSFLPAAPSAPERAAFVSDADQVQSVAAAQLSGFAPVEGGEQLQAYGCSQSGAGAWAPALLLLIAAAFLPRPAALRVRGRERR